MGQSWVDGHLPYTELWDLKPPITFLYFACFIYLFGKSFFAIRLGGAIMVAIISFYTYLTASTITNKKTALYTSIACVALLSLFGSLQGVMSEHISMLFFMPGLYLLMNKERPLWLFISGCLFGLSVMTKINLAYPILMLALYLLFLSPEKRTIPGRMMNVVLFGLGVLFIILSTFLPYLLKEIPEVWWNSVVLAPLEYTGARRYPLVSFLPITLFLGLLLFYHWKQKILDFHDKKIQILLLALIAILISFIKGGRINGHYLIQLHPMLVILVAMAFGTINQLKKPNYKPFLLAIVALIPMESYLEYANILKHKFEYGTFYNGEGFSVPLYIENNKLETNNILFLGYHIGYWVLEKKPPTKAATHPSNICRDELFQFYDNPRQKSLEELHYIMETLRPKTVIIRKNRLIFDKKEEEQNAYIDAYLNEHYEVLATVEKAEILQRL
jgi:hypothetical protein